MVVYMRKELIKIVKKFPKTAKFMKKVDYQGRHFKVSVGKFLRSHNLYPSKRYDKLKELKNKYEGKRCFIISTGPSLQISDLEKLKGEYCFGMNSIALAFKDTTWRPNFMGVQDWDVYMKIKDSLESENIEKVFLSRNLSKRIKMPKEYVEFPLDLLDHCTNFETADTIFSDDCYSMVYDGYTVTYSLMQLAVYMGFKEIYLLGNDCNYNGNKMYFRDHGVNIFDKDLAVLRYFAAYEVAKKYADEHGIKIYNATRGGKLEIFERVNFDDIIK